MEQDIASDPTHVGALGTDGIVFEADGVTSAGSVQARTRSSSFLEVGSIAVSLVQVDFSWILLYNVFIWQPGTFRKRAGNKVIIHKISANATLGADWADSV